jgi:hypothetical protein
MSPVGTVRKTRNLESSILCGRVAECGSRYRSSVIYVRDVIDSRQALIAPNCTSIEYHRAPKFACSALLYLDLLYCEFKREKKKKKTRLKENIIKC